MDIEKVCRAYTEAQVENVCNIGGNDMAGGWKNEATWEVAMSIGNDRIIYDYWTKEAFACLDANSTLRSPCCCTEADMEENAIRDLAALLEKSLYKRIALSVVAWDEIARYIIADLRG